MRHNQREKPSFPYIHQLQDNDHRQECNEDPDEVFPVIEERQKTMLKRPKDGDNKH